uniref:Protein phosphatase 6 regulatory subunit 2 n=1 Tax=Oncorhynchus kisutch TaxID=8019 RepID=A0A8C7J2P6_ONCKI
MFWKFDLHTTSHIDQLLDREDVTLLELMEEDDVLQECKAQNRRLLLFLSQDHCMTELVNLITTEPPADLEEKSRFKFPNIACELLTSDVSLINDKLGGDTSLLETLYHFLEQDPPLNPLLASFFSKTIGNLIARKTEQVISFLRKKDGFIGLVLKHIDASAMMDLLLRLISCVEPAPLRQEVLNWLSEEKLIQRLTELIHTGKDEERQSNASQTLCDIIRLSRDQANQMQENVETDPLLAVLESQESVAGLLKTMFEGERSEASIVNGTQVLLTLLETRRSGNMVIHPPCLLIGSGFITTNKSAILTTVGLLEEPLGNARLHVARLVAALLQTSAPSVCQELCKLTTMDQLLDLFFKYSWNNFLHFQVELCVASILNHSVPEERPIPGLQNHEEKLQAGPENQGEAGAYWSESVKHCLPQLFQKCRLVQRILDAWEENDQIQAEGGARRGNMGHLTRMANMVVQNLEKGPVQSQISDLIKELPEDCRGRWESFVDETLRETNRRNTVELVSTHNLHSSSEDDDMESPFPNDLSLQQAFSDYQIQQMTANFVDQFGFNDEEFSEHDENINATFDRIAEINFNLDADDNSANATAFEACCKERIRQFDDAEEEEDIWEEKEINYATQVKSRTRLVKIQDTIINGLHFAKHYCRLFPLTMLSCEGPSWTASFGEAGGNSSSPGPAGWDSPGGNGGDKQEAGWANFTEFQPFMIVCPGASPSAGGEWPVGEGRKAPLVASDSSSSGGSDSEDDDKTAATATETIKNAEVKRFV